MAQIPDAFSILQGDTPSGDSRVRPYVSHGGEYIAAGIQQLGRGLGDLAGGYAEAQKRAEIQQVNLARAQSANAALDHQIAVETTAQQIDNDVQSGKIKYTDARQAFDDQAAKIQPAQIPNLDPVGQENYDKAIKRNVATVGFKVDTMVAGAQRQDYKDQFTGNLNRLGKLSTMPGADIDGLNRQADSFAPLAIAAGVPRVQVDTMLQNFKDANWFNQGTERIMAAKDSLPGLKQIQTDLTAEDGFYQGKLDPQKRNELLHQVQSNQQILENRYAMLENKREARAAHTMNLIDQQISTGLPLPPSAWAEAGTVVKGTSYESEFNEAIKGEAEVQDVLRRPIAEQQSYLQQKTEELQQGTKTGDVASLLRSRANLVRLATAVDQNVKLMQNTPLLYAAGRAGVDIQPLDFSKMQSPDGQAAIGKEIADRMSTISALRAQNGPQVGVKPLLPQEAGLLTNALQTAPVAQRASLLVGLRQAINNDTAYQAAMLQIAPHSPVTSIAGQMVGENAPSSTPLWFDPAYAPKIQDVQRVLGGEALLNPTAAGGKEAAANAEPKSRVALPPETGPAGLRALYGQAAADLFKNRPDLGEDYYSVFKNVYASMLSDAGNFKGQPDHDALKESLRVSLGTDRQVSYNGNTFVVPAGMDPSRFKGLLESAVATTAQALKAPADWKQRMAGYQLEEVGGLGSGRYILMNGNARLVAPDGKGYFPVIDLHDQYLASRGARAAAGAVPRGTGGGAGAAGNGFIWDAAQKKLVPDPSLAPGASATGNWGS